jgi:hypothetical protein
MAAMAVGIRLKFPGGTQQQYDMVHGYIDVDNDPPDGLIFHSAGPIDEGWGIIDFWESSEAFDRFSQGRLMPAVAALGDRAFPSPPDRKDFPVHNIHEPIRRR